MNMNLTRIINVEGSDRDLPRTVYIRIKQLPNRGWDCWVGLEPLIANDPFREPVGLEIWFISGPTRAETLKKAQDGMRKRFNVVEFKVEEVSP